MQRWHLVCNATTTATPETCDNIDNDCDGQVDDGNPGGGNACNTGQPGACAAGTSACSAGTIVCNANNTPVPETCDGIDNDCNGQVDDGNPGGGNACSTGQPGACNAGTTACNAGTIVCNATTTATPETCDNIDNDCNEQVDDGNPGGGNACNTGQPGACAAGTSACSAGTIVCNPNNTPVPETCDNIDNDCDGQVDNGNPGGGNACNTGQPGACAAGTSACSAGTIVCNPNNTPTTELCDNIDNDCDGQVDDGNPGGGNACNTGQFGPCWVGTLTCTGGSVVCKANTLPSPESCDGIDNDCNGQVDDGNPGGGNTCTTGQPGACNQGTTQCNDGALECIATSATPESCDNIDNDCDGVVDNGNPGGGTPCGAAIGACGEYTVCQNGSLVCRGAFVAPAGVGAPNNPGTRALPVSTIAKGQQLAAAIGNGTAVCVCDPPTQGASFYRESITMIEGISILGGFNCADWSRAPSTYYTIIQPDWFGFAAAPAMIFPPGITSATVLDGISAYGADPPPMPQANTSIAMEITDASPTLVNVSAIGGKATYSYGLKVSASAGKIANPTVMGGGFGAQSSNPNGVFGEMIGAIVTNGSGTFTNVIFSNNGSAGGSTGLCCIDCSSTVVGGQISGGSAPFGTTGLSVQGNTSGFSVTNTSITGGSPGNGTTHGADFYNCIGSPTLTGVQISGGTTTQGASTSVHSSGASCTPIITNSTILGGNAPGGVVGVNYIGGSACNISDSTIQALSPVRCQSGGCGTFTGNTMKAGWNQSFGGGGIGIDIDGSSPVFDGNDISSPSCPNPLPANTQIAAARIINGMPVLTNNVLRDQPCMGPVDLIFSENSGPVLINNTLQFATCTGCGRKRGLVVNGSTGAGSVRNNIFLNAGNADFTNAYLVYENNATSDLPFFENNALWAPSGGILYWDEGTTSPSIAGINGLMGSTGNIHADPMLDATFHLLATSPCLNAGTATNAPAFDFEGDMRPQELSYDIGADEYVP